MGIMRECGTYGFGWYYVREWLSDKVIFYPVCYDEIL